jgi:hypothetical protein
MDIDGTQRSEKRVFAVVLGGVGGRVCMIVREKGGILMVTDEPGPCEFRLFHMD